MRSWRFRSVTRELDSMLAAVPREADKLIAAIEAGQDAMLAHCPEPDRDFRDARAGSKLKTKG